MDSHVGIDPLGGWIALLHEGDSGGEHLGPGGVARKPVVLAGKLDELDVLVGRLQGGRHFPTLFDGDFGVVPPVNEEDGRPAREASLIGDTSFRDESPGP